jgi:type IV secretion system protein TrbC
MTFFNETLRRKYGRFGAVAVASLAAASSARASTNTSLTMLETPLQTLQSSLQGPVALAIGIIAVAITGGMLIFGGEISDFGKRMAYVVLVLAILLTANTLVPALFSTSTAVIF